MDCEETKATADNENVKFTKIKTLTTWGFYIIAIITVVIIVISITVTKFRQLQCKTHFLTWSFVVEVAFNNPNRQAIPLAIFKARYSKA